MLELELPVLGLGPELVVQPVAHSGAVVAAEHSDSQLAPTFPSRGQTQPSSEPLAPELP